MIGKKFSKDSLAIECNTRNVIEFGIFLVEKKNFNIEKKKEIFWTSMRRGNVSTVCNT